MHDAIDGLIDQRRRALEALQERVEALQRLAERLLLARQAEAGVDAEVIDLRSLVPLDIDCIVASVKKTGRCVIIHEATRTGGFGAELSAQVQENCFMHLEAQIVRVAGWDTPYPHAFEWEYFPGPKRVGDALKRVMEG